MKKLLISLMAITIFATPSMLHAENTYLSISGGLALQNDADMDNVANVFTFKNGHVLNGAIGVISDEFRLEAEIGYLKSDADTYFGYKISNTGVSLLTVMINAYADLDTESRYVPYMTAGLGYSDATLTFVNTNYSSSQIVMQIGAGVGIRASDQITVDLCFRILKPADGNFASSDISLAGKSLTAGIRYRY